MKVLVVKRPNVVQYVEMPKPRAGNDMVVAKVKRTGICATDLSILTGDAKFMKDGSTSYPVRFGHEWSGIVESVGKNVTDFIPGDLVISDSGVSCGKCPKCKSGLWEECINSRSVGTINTWPGAYAEYVSFPARHLYKMPSPMSYDQAALLEPAAIAYDGIRRMNITDETSVLVSGTGAIGMCAVALIASLNLGRLVLSGRQNFKLEIGKQLGADGACNVCEQRLEDFIHDEFGGTGVDYVLECSGNITAFNDSVNVLKMQGVLLAAAYYEKLLDGFDIDKFTQNGCRLEPVGGSYEATRGIVKIMLDNPVDFAPIITKHIKFEEASDEMYRMVRNHTKADIKVMVDFD